MGGVAFELGIRLSEQDPPDVERTARFASELFLGGMARLAAREHLILDLACGLGQSSPMHVVAMAGPTGTGAPPTAPSCRCARSRERGHRAEFSWDQRNAPPPFEQLRQADVVHMWRLFRGPARRLARR